MGKIENMAKLEESLKSLSIYRFVIKYNQLLIIYRFVTRHNKFDLFKIFLNDAHEDFNKSEIRKCTKLDRVYSHRLIILTIWKRINFYNLNSHYQAPEPLFSRVAF